MKLNQLIAIEKGTKTGAEKVATDVYQALQKKELVEGMTRSYTPNNAEDPEKLPTENKLIKMKADVELEKVAAALNKYFDVAACKEKSNCLAKADIKIDGVTLVADVPVGFLLFLEKQLVNWLTQAKKAPVLDPSFSWKWDPAKCCYVSDAVTQNKTRKVLRNHVKAVATDKHPAQVDTYTEDMVVGSWATIQFSGALRKDVVEALTDRAEKLLEAVKLAREEANAINTAEFKPGAAIFDYLTVPLDAK